MRVRVGIIDYRVGNIGSVAAAMSRVGMRPFVAQTRQDISKAQALVLPGVGSFDMAMRTLQTNHLVAPLQEAIREQSKPVLGICLGMQIFGHSSEEAPGLNGLGLIDATTRLLTSETGRIPHTGWTEVSATKESPVEGCYYFSHSFRLYCKEEHTLAKTRGPAGFPACIRDGNIFGCQFHPEKSQADGERFLHWFSSMVQEIL
jgi:glutamine amidotransferase